MTDVITNEKLMVSEEAAADIPAQTSSEEPTAEAKEVSTEDQTVASNAEDHADTIDYEALMIKDVAELKEEFPELSGIESVTDLHNPLRYAALRDMGLTPAEAYLATAKRVAHDTRAHLRSAHGRNAAASSLGMSQTELAMARELFPGKNDAELQRLYKRVSK